MNKHWYKLYISFRRIFYLVTAVIAGLSVTSCADSDDNNTPDPQEPVEVTTGVYKVVNLAADTTATSSENANTLYYSLENGKAVSSSMSQTDQWDIAFLQTYNSSIAANNGKGLYSPGYGGPGKGGIYLVINQDVDAAYYTSAGKPIKEIPDSTLFQQAFSAIKTVPVSDDKFLISDYIGLDYFQGSGAGWAWYDFYNELFPDRPASEKAHVAYALPRPIIVRTAKGNYAKVIIYSVYKDAPANPDRSNKAGYITFSYAIQKDGSKNLDISQ
ncbi:HmuY family protein [Xanthocytophaga agilis]|uniref:HmuY family protein n=1 Tax=Xanthocytophaga agilis TaxID=3048010 RepID=A0AAE3RBP3_9BACT|nr:HmuY family protein [Xanthocytophaga agilis]MDJ1505239.1 HmuY family protein [Xanthocytophaga agilis]